MALKSIFVKRKFFENLVKSREMANFALKL